MWRFTVTYKQHDGILKTIARQSEGVGDSRHTPAVTWAHFYDMGQYYDGGFCDAASMSVRIG